MKIRFLLAAVLATASFSAASVVYAATPTLSLSGTGTDSVTVTVTGDANSTVVLWYNIGSSNGAATKILGTTNSSGQLSSTITVSTLQPPLDTTKNVYLMVAGQQSASQAWSTSASTPTGYPSLSQSAITVSTGQTTTVTSQGSSASVYVLSNSSPAIATISTSGNQITITGNQVGSTQLSICYSGTSSNCVTLAITVNSSGTSNSNSSSISFNPSTATVAAGQSIGVSISGGSGYYVSMNSNPGITSHTLSGSIITVNGVIAGSASLTICTLTGVCSSLPVTVTAGAVTTTTSSGATVTNNAATTFSNANPTLAAGQTLSITISGSPTYYIAVNTNQIPVQASVAANLLTLTGVTSGTTALTICPSGGTTGCSTMNVTVTGAGATTTPATTTTTPAPTTVAPVVTTPTANSSASLLTTIQTMQSQLAQIALAVQTMQSQLSQIVSAFGALVPSSVAATPLDTSSSASFSGKFVSLLSSGSTGPEVTALQKKLIAGGYLSGDATGYFGAATQAAVKKFQAANGIEAAGYTGPSTRAALNAQ